MTQRPQSTQRATRGGWGNNLSLSFSAFSARSASSFSFLLLAGVLAGCQNAGHDRVLGIEATSEVRGFAYFDANRSRRIDSVDTPIQGLRVFLSDRGTSDTVATAVSAASGTLSFNAVPVGGYDVRLDQASVGDSLVLVRIDTSQVDLAPGDTVAISVGVSYPLLTVAEARTATTGQKVFVAGVALTATNLFADTTAHLVAATGPLRLVRVLTGLAPGDSVNRFAPGDSVLARGTVSVRDGEPVLRDVSVFRLGIGTLSAAESLATATVGSANGGVLDAGLARAGGTLQDTVTVGRDLVLDVDDGSGVLRVLLDADLALQPSPYLVNPARVIATGVLVPAGAGKWYLKPRSNLDIHVQVDVVPTAQVRQKTSGTRLFVDGVALSRPNLYGDSTMHMADTSGAIRVVKTLQGNIFAGDSIRVAGVVASRDGQAVISASTIYRLGFGAAPLARLVTTAEAASAIGGTLDAAFVRITGTIDTAYAGSGGDFRAVVNDGSGAVTVLLDGDVGFNTTPWVKGASVDARGLLVPESGVWVVKPRAPTDVVQP